MKTRIEITVKKPANQKGKRKPTPRPLIRTGSSPDVLSRRKTGAGFYDVGQIPMGGGWTTFDWILHRNAYNTGPDQIPQTESFDLSGGTPSHNANFTALDLADLRQRRPIKRTESDFYGLTISADSLPDLPLNSAGNWNGNKPVIPANYYQQSTFAITSNNERPALFAKNIQLKGGTDIKITATNNYSDPAAAFTPTPTDTYYLIPIPAQHLGSAYNDLFDSVLVDVSAFRYRSRIDLDSPSTIIEYVSGKPSDDPTGYAKFLQACEYQSGFTEMELWFTDSATFPTAPFQFVNQFPTAAAAFDAILQGRADFNDRSYASWFSNNWHTNDGEPGLLLAIVGQGSNLFYVWGTA